MSFLGNVLWLIAGGLVTGAPDFAGTRHQVGRKILAPTAEVGGLLGPSGCGPKNRSKPHWRLFEQVLSRLSDGDTQSDPPPPANSGALYVLAGLVLCLTVVGIPFGLQAIKLGLATMTPFGKRIVEGPNANSPLRVIFNLIWVLCVGWGIAAAHLASAAFCALTIIGIPFAVQHIKLIPLSLLPFGRDLR